jgi:hypothetical protein
VIGHVARLEEQADVRPVEPRMAAEREADGAPFEPHVGTLEQQDMEQRTPAGDGQRIVGHPK